MSNDTSYHSTLRIIFWTRTAKSESQSVPLPLHFHQLAFSFFHAYGYAYGSPEISRFSLLSNNLALLNLYVYHPCVPLSSKLVSSSSVVSLSPPILSALLDVAKSFTWHLQHIVMKHTWLALWVVLHCRFCPAFPYLFFRNAFSYPILLWLCLFLCSPTPRNPMA